MYTLLATGDVPGAATYFNPLLQQSIIPCTSGTRPASPAAGWTIYETDTARYAKYTGAIWEYWAGSRITYGPAVTATSVSPTLGSGSVSGGWYVYLPGPSIHFTFFVQFGTTGVAAGTGQYQVVLPVTAATISGIGSGQPAMGSGMLRDNSAGSIQSATTYIPGSNLAVCSMVSDSTGGTVGAAVPWVWAASDYLAGSITYPI